MALVRPKRIHEGYPGHAQVSTTYIDLTDDCSCAAAWARKREEGHNVTTSA